MEPEDHPGKDLFPAQLFDGDCFEEPVGDMVQGKGVGVGVYKVHVLRFIVHFLLTINFTFPGTSFLPISLAMYIPSDHAETSISTGFSSGIARE